ncbi:hypothetical protein EV1_000507 [Malus domestica]
MYTSHLDFASTWWVRKCMTQIRPPISNRDSICIVEPTGPAPVPLNLLNPSPKVGLGGFWTILEARLGSKTGNDWAAKVAAMN